MVINQLDPKKGYYHISNVEADIRSIAKQFSHTYTLGLFACCREIYFPHKHCGLEGPTKEAATDKFTKKLRAKLILEIETEDAKKIEAKKLLEEDLKTKSE